MLSSSTPVLVHASLRTSNPIKSAPSAHSEQEEVASNFLEYLARQMHVGLEDAQQILGTWLLAYSPVRVPASRSRWGQR